MVETIKEEYRTARKSHICDYCLGEIKKGQVYNYAVNKLDGDVYTWKAHKECMHIATELWNYLDPLEGMTQEDFDEGCFNFCRTFVCPDCDRFCNDCGECLDDKRYCIDKIYDILQKYYLGRSEENPYIYKLFPRKDGDLNEEF